MLKNTVPSVPSIFHMADVQLYTDVAEDKEYRFDVLKALYDSTPVSLFNTVPTFDACVEPESIWAEI
jgi:hypothetical protein